jgi:hypothetical protein
MVKRAGNSCSPVRGSFLEDAMFEVVSVVHLVRGCCLDCCYEGHLGSRMFQRFPLSHKFHVFYSTRLCLGKNRPGIQHYASSLVQLSS